MDLCSFKWVDLNANSSVLCSKITIDDFQNKSEIRSYCGFTSIAFQILLSYADYYFPFWCFLSLLHGGVISFLYGDSLKKNTCMTLNRIKTKDSVKIPHKVSQSKMIYSHLPVSFPWSYLIFAVSHSASTQHTLKMFGECLQCVTCCSSVLSALLGRGHRTLNKMKALPSRGLHCSLRGSQ